MPIHVVQIIPSLRFGGAERNVVDVVNHLDPALVRSSVILFHPDRPLAPELGRHAAVYDVRGFGPLKIIPLYHLLKKLKPDIVHTHLFGADAWGRIAAYFAGIPTVSTEHNVRPESALKGWFKRKLCHLSVAYLATSEAIHVWMKDFYRITAPITTVRCGISTERFASVPPVPAAAPELFKLLMIGRLTEQKGYDIALKALAHVPGNWQLTCVGEGELYEPLAALAQELGLKDRINFVRTSLAIPELFTSHHLLIAPSRWEGLGIVVMEAMAAGRAVIAARTGGLTELVEDGITGALFEVENTSQLAEKIIWYHKHWDALCGQGEAARVRSQRCSITAVARLHESVYERVAGVND